LFPEYGPKICISEFTGAEWLRNAKGVLALTMDCNRYLHSFLREKWYISIILQIFLQRVIKWDADTHTQRKANAVSITGLTL